MVRSRGHLTQKKWRAHIRMHAVTHHLGLPPADQRNPLGRFPSAIYIPFSVSLLPCNRISFPSRFFFLTFSLFLSLSLRFPPLYFSDLQHDQQVLSAIISHLDSIPINPLRSVFVNFQIIIFFSILIMFLHTRFDLFAR